MDPKLAFQEINKYSGTQFCPKIVNAFNKAYETGLLNKKIKINDLNIHKQIA